MPKNDNNRNYINFWPFDSYKDGVRRHWDWLRRWLLAHERTRLTVGGLLLAGLLVAMAAGVWHIVLQDLTKRPFQPANSIQVKNVQANKPAQAVQTASSVVYSKPEVRESLNLALPLRGQVTVSYGMGYSTLYQDFRFHQGIDVLSTKDDVVRAVLPGQVRTVGQSEGEGLTITIRHADGYLTSYANITSPEVTVGQKVKRGQAIAKVEAETGTLHFAIQKGQQGLNPLQYLSY